MPITGTGPLDSTNAQSEYQLIVYSVIRRINSYIAGPVNPKVAENSVLGDLVALVALCKIGKMGKNIGKTQVAEWRDKFVKWFESAKIPKKFRDGYKASALALFDELEELAGSLPKAYWHTGLHTGPG